MLTSDNLYQDSNGSQDMQQIERMTEVPADKSNRSNHLGYRALWSLRFLGLTVACMAIGTAGCIYAFNAYAPAVKRSFNFTQTEVDLMGSVGNLGICFGLPPGLVMEYCGPRITSVVALLLSTLGFILMWSSTLAYTFYHTRAWLLDIYFFFASTGSIFTYMCCLPTNMNNFPPKHRGTIIGLLDASYSAGPAIISAFYAQCFVNGHVEDAENQDLSGFWLFSAVILGVFDTLVIFCLHTFPYGSYKSDDNTDDFTGSFEVTDSINDSLNDRNYNESTGLVANQRATNQNGEKIADATTKENDENITGLELLKNIDFHLLFWTIVFCGGLQQMYIFNLTTYLNSFHLQKWNATFTIVQPVIASLSKLASGILSDAIVHKVPRVLILIILNTLQTIILIICIFKADSLIMMWISMFSISLAFGAIWCLTPAMMSEFLGMKYFARNWGCTFMGIGIFGLGTQKAFGALYDEQVDIGTDCFGLQCFQKSFLIAAILSLISVIFNVVLFLRHFRQHKDRNTA